MFRSTSNRNIFSVKPVQLIGILFVLIPLENEKKGRKLFGYTCYSLLVVIAVLCSYARATYEYIVETTSDIMIAGTVLGILNAVTATIWATSSFLSAFWNGKVFQQFLQNFTKIDTLLRIRSPNKTHHVVVIELILTHVMYISIVLYDIHTYGNTIDSIFMVSLLYTQAYFSMVIVLLIYNYSTLIRHRFVRLKKYLQEVVKVHGIVNQSYKISPNMTVTTDFYHSQGANTLKITENILRAFRLLCETVELFNRIFGWQILFVFGAVLLQVLDIVCTVITIPNDISSTLRYLVVTSDVIWFVFFTVMGGVVTVSCDLTTKEAQRTANVCYCLLLDIPVMSKNIQDRILRKQLVLLARQATHQCPYFSAAGFFKVKISLLFGLLSTVTSYIIILIQINK